MKTPLHDAFTSVGTQPLFDSWLETVPSDTYPPEPVLRHQTLLETPKRDDFRAEAGRVFQALEKCKYDLTALPEVDAATKIIYDEAQSWGASSPAIFCASPSARAPGNLHTDRSSSEADSLPSPGAAESGATARNPGEGDSLLAQFQRWDQAKQESFVNALSAFQVHSFAIEGDHLSLEAVRAATVKALRKGNH